MMSGNSLIFRENSCVPSRSSPIVNSRITWEENFKCKRNIFSTIFSIRLCVIIFRVPISLHFCRLTTLLPVLLTNK